MSKLKTKLESIRVSGDKGELWNFEASFLLGVLEGAEMNKKITDLMARQINNYDAQLVINKFRSKEDVLDWAKSEVLKDE